MGWCHQFGSQVAEGCDHPMVAGEHSCTCPECGVACTGRFRACPTVWAHGPHISPALDPERPGARAVRRARAPTTTPAGTPVDTGVVAGDNPVPILPSGGIDLFAEVSRVVVDVMTAMACRDGQRDGENLQAFRDEIRARIDNLIAPVSPIVGPPGGRANGKDQKLPPGR